MNPAPVLSTTRSSVSEFEITALILSEHEVFRRDFAALEEMTDTAQLTAAWEALAARLEVHAVGEEELFYPVLAVEAEDGAEEGKHAVHDHNEIRHAAHAVAEHEVGSDAWWEAVRTTREVNGDHMAEEETGFLPDFKQNVDAERREELGMRWLEFHDVHEDAEGLSGEDADPEEVVTAEPVA